LTYTAVWRATERPEEALADYTSLVRLLSRSGEIDAGTTDLLLEAAAADPSEATAAVERAIALREAIYRILVARIADKLPRDPDLAMLNGELAEAMAAARIRPIGNAFAWDWADATERTMMPLALPLWMVARSAAELLTSSEVDRVKRCPGTGCGWLFLDTSKNGSRRWCSMEGCGNRARVRAFAARKRSEPDVDVGRK
jgi:predicted RNA-binding Zn ribbon-like protein